MNKIERQVLRLAKLFKTEMTRKSKLLKNEKYLTIAGACVKNGITYLTNAYYAAIFKKDYSYLPEIPLVDEETYPPFDDFLVDVNRFVPIRGFFCLYTLEETSVLVDGRPTVKFGEYYYDKKQVEELLKCIGLTLEKRDNSLFYLVPSDSLPLLLIKTEDFMGVVCPFLKQIKGKKENDIKNS